MDNQIPTISSLNNHVELITISGRKGVGKDTTALWLKQKYEANGAVVHILSLASSLKEATALIFGWDVKKMDGLTAEDRQWREQIDQFWSSMLPSFPNITPRSMLQIFGTDLVRKKIDDRIWVFSTLKKMISLNAIAKAQNPNQRVVFIVPDARFLNESQTFRQYFPKICCLYIKSNRNSLDENCVRHIGSWVAQQDKPLDDPKLLDLIREVLLTVFHGEHISELEPLFYVFFRRELEVMILENNYSDINQYHGYLSTQCAHLL